MKENKLLKGRQIGWFIFSRYKIRECEGGMLNFQDIMNIRLKGGNLRGFLNDWDSTFERVDVLPSEDQKEILFRRQLVKHDSLKSMMELYEQDITHRGATRSYEVLRTMVNRFLTQQRDMRNEEQYRKGTTEKAHTSTTRKKPDPNKRRTGECMTYWKTGKCKLRDEGKCQWLHDRTDPNKDIKPRKKKKKGKR